MIRLLVVDDDALFRAGLIAVLGTEPDLEVVGEAADGAEVREALDRAPVDVVLMDVHMPRVDGIDATRRIVARPDAPRVLVLTTFENDEYVAEALRAGAHGFVLKRARPDELARAIRTVAAGDSLLFPDAVRRLVGGPRRRRAPWADRLTAREREVLALVARGLSNAEIAATLYVSAETVKTHVSALLAKAGARDRTGIVVAAYSGGLIEPGEG